MVRVDLTPMVDLGFILVTFFVFTTTLSESMAMDMITPKKGDEDDKICETCALTFIPLKGDSIWYYNGMESNANYQLTTIKEVRKIISDRKKWVKSVRGTDQLQVIIKGTANAEFKDMVDLIDECSITLVKRYYMDELSEEQQRRFN